jgi:hypothetical protein
MVKSLLSLSLGLFIASRATSVLHLRLHSFERLYDDLWARRGVGQRLEQNDAQTRAAVFGRVGHFSQPAELAHVQRRVTDVAADFEVRVQFVLDFVFPCFPTVPEPVPDQ